LLSPFRPSPHRSACRWWVGWRWLTGFLAADKLRKNLEPSDYKHVELSLIFLKYISNAFESKRAALLAEDAAGAEDPDEYLAENVFWVPKVARGHNNCASKPRLPPLLLSISVLAAFALGASLAEFLRRPRGMIG
jgi:type I restriction-modification system DNA methylase subunit